MPGQSAQPATIRTSAAPAATRPANRRTGETLRGVLKDIDCRRGLNLTLQASGKTVKLRTDSAFSVEFIARDSDGRAVTSAPVVCGPTLDDGVDVSVLYRPERSGDSLGEPLVVGIQIPD